MTCNEAKACFMDLLYEELSSDRQKQVQHHLNRCSSCREAFEELRSTRVLLQQLPEEDPGTKLMFMAPERRSFTVWLRQLGAALPRSFTGRLAFGAVAAMLLILIAGSLANLHISYENGRLDIQMHLTDTHPVVRGDEAEAALLARVQEETAALVARLHAAERTEQEEKLNRMFSAFARDLQRLQQQHDNDVMLIGQNLEQLHRVTNYQFGETSEVLQRLVQYIGYEK